MSNIFGYISLCGASMRPRLADDMMQAMADWHPDVARYAALPKPEPYLVTSDELRVTQSHATQNPKPETRNPKPETLNSKLQTSGFFGSLLLRTTPESFYETLPYTDPVSGLTITADARIDNRNELAPILGLTDNVQTPDSLFILHAYRQWGRLCCQHLLGDYAFAVWDSRRGELFVARDHIGARALFYYADSTRFIFATEPKGIVATGEVSNRLTDDWIANILVGVTPAKDQAPFEGMKKLPPAHCLTVSPGGIRMEQYWDLDVNREIRYRREQDYYDHLRALIEQAVRRCTRSAYPVGAELSGGLDSSGIAAFAQAELKKKGGELHTFSHVLPDWAIDKIYPFGDERQCINSVCNHAGITQQHFITAEGKGILDEFQLCTRRFGYPTGYYFPVFCDALYEEAQASGVRVLLSGFPGDELVTSHGAEFLGELMHRHRYLTLWHELNVRNDHRFFKTWYSLAVRMLLHHAPGVAHLIRGNPPEEVNWRDNMFRCCVATDAYAEKMHLRQRLFETTTYPVFNSVRKREQARITDIFVCHRLEQCAVHALYCGVEYRNPFVDRNLLEYVHALPAEVKVRGRVKRYPYRMAIAGMVPENIRWRDDKAGTTIPSVTSRVIADNQHLDALLNNPEMSWPSFVDVYKMLDIKKRLNNRQLKDALYPHAFYSVLMMKQ